MIREALQYIVGLKEPSIKEIGGNTYSDKTLTRIIDIPYADEVKLSTLTSLVEYIESGIDKMKGRMIVHVVSPTKVKLYSELDSERKRENIAVVVAELPSFRFDEFIDNESFVIALQSKFIDNHDKELLMKFAGTVEAGTVTSYGDDGVSQKATVKTGITQKQDALVPNPVTLIPYRTFLEVEQPESQFIFRMKQDKYNDSIGCAIFEADGGAWRQAAMQNVKAYLQDALKEHSDYIVIS